MKYVIIGNGPASVNAAQKMRQLSPEADIILVSEEAQPYYARPRLPEFIAGQTTADKLTVFPLSWYAKQQIQLILNTTITNINTTRKTVFYSGHELSYDKLLLATGAKAFIPALPGNDLPGVFSLRSLADAIRIREYAQNKKDIILIGGGLLGLELAGSFCQPNRKIIILEHSASLLSRQLTPDKGAKLRSLLEQRGMIFHFLENCTSITNSPELTVLTKDHSFTGQMIIFSAGVSPRSELAQSSGLNVKKGIIVNEFLQTSAPEVYAAGDCLQLGDKLWGFVKSATEQGKVAAENMVLGNKLAYQDTLIEVSLKVSGIDLKQL